MKYEKSEMLGARAGARKPGLMTAVGVASLAMTGWLGAGASAQAQESNDIVVTGSRIVTPGFTAPIPVTSVSQADLELTVAKQANQIQYQIPQLIPNISVQGTGPYAGAPLNLRGFGSSRTLLLLDGRRVAPTSYTGSTDANIIPTSLIKRVDVVTGGASAAYGSDAVAGVVNFILDTNYEGLKGSVSAGESMYHDMQEVDFTLTGGFSFGGGKGHVVVSAEGFRNSGSSGCIQQTCSVAKRPYANKGWALIPGGAGFPAQIAAPNVKFSQLTTGGIIQSGPLKGIYFGDGASINNMVYGTNISATYMVGGNGDQNQLYGSIAPELSRQSIFARASYELTPNVTVWGQVIGIHSYIWGPGVPNYDNTANTLFMKIDNPFMPASIRTQMTTLGLTQFSFGRIDTEMDLGANRGLIHDTLVDLGVNGHIGDWNWDLTAQFNSNEDKYHFENDRNNALWAQGVDVVANPAVGGVPGVAAGAPVCRSTLTGQVPTGFVVPGTNTITTTSTPGVLSYNGLLVDTKQCVPINLFGNNSMTPAMVKYVNGTNEYLNPSETWNAMGNLSGVLFQNWAGDVSVATGFEARRNWVHGSVDPVTAARMWRGNNTQPFNAHAFVKEAYVEADIPLAKDVPLFQEFSTNMAFRRANYDTFGNNDTWKIGLNDQVTDDLRIRAALSQDLRAPTLNDLYQAPGSNQGQFFNNVTKQTQTLITSTAGNPALQPEVGRTKTFGFVYSPSFVPGFTAAIDYYKLKLKDGIQTTTAQQQIDNCQLFNIADACSKITVNAVGQVTAITVTSFNVANSAVDGVDTEFTYNFPGDVIWDKLNGNFRLRFAGTYVNAIISKTTAGVVTNSVMQTTAVGAGISGGIPKWKFVTSANYSTDKWTFLLDFRFTGALRVNNLNVEGVDIDNNHIPSRYYVNASAEHEIRDGWKIFGRVNNLFNVEPPVNPSNGLIVPTTSVSQNYDRIGRAYSAGVRFAF